MSLKASSSEVYLPTVPYMCPFGCGNDLQQTSPNTAICRNCGRLIFAVEPRKLDKVAA